MFTAIIGIETGKIILILKNSSKDKYHLGKYFKGRVKLSKFIS